MKGSISRKPLDRKKCVIMGRDFLLINRNLQPSLEINEPVQFFRRDSVSVVEVRARFKLFQGPLNCDLEVLSHEPNTSTTIEIECMTACEPILLSIGIQTPQDSNVRLIGFQTPSKVQML